MIKGKYNEIVWSNTVDIFAWMMIRNRLLLILLSIAYYGMESLLIYVLIGMRSRIENFQYRSFLTVIMLVIATQYYWLIYLISIETLRFVIIGLPHILRFIHQNFKMKRNPAIETFIIRLFKKMLENNDDIFETAPIIIHMLNDLYNGVDNGKIDNNLYWDVNNNIDNLEETLICIEDKKIYIILDEHILILWFIGINYVKK